MCSVPIFFNVLSGCVSSGQIYTLLPIENYISAMDSHKRCRSKQTSDVNGWHDILSLLYVPLSLHRTIEELFLCCGAFVVLGSQEKINRIRLWNLKGPDRILLVVCVDGWKGEVTVWVTYGDNYTDGLLRE